MAEGPGSDQEAFLSERSKHSDLDVYEMFCCGMLQIIAAQEEMLRKEKELEEARNRLAMIRKQQYKFLPSELREDGQEQ